MSILCEVFKDTYVNKVVIILLYWWDMKDCESFFKSTAIQKKSWQIILLKMKMLPATSV